MLTAKNLNRALWAVATALGATVTTLVAGNHDVPLALAIANAVVAALAAGQHLPTPGPK